MLLIFNLPGIIMLIAAFGTSLSVQSQFGVSKEGPLMLVAGPLLMAADVIYRGTRDERHWFQPNHGGMFFYVPIWAWGFFWLVLGIGYTARG